MFSEIVEMERITQADTEESSQENAGVPYVWFHVNEVPGFWEHEVRTPETLYCDLYCCRERSRVAPAIY